MANPPNPLPPASQNLLPDYAVIAIANKHSAQSLSDPSKPSIYTEQFIAAIQEALVEAEIRAATLQQNAVARLICVCGQRGPHSCPYLKTEEKK
jgi:hypothetical protein